jgi:hypothetical protein
VVLALSEVYFSFLLVFVNFSKMKISIQHKKTNGAQSVKQLKTGESVKIHDFENFQKITELKIKSFIEKQKSLINTYYNMSPLEQYCNNKESQSSCNNNNNSHTCDPTVAVWQKSPPSSSSTPPSDSSMQNNNTINPETYEEDLEKKLSILSLQIRLHCLVRLSFIKKFGVNTKYPHINLVPCWLDVTFEIPKRFLRKRIDDCRDDIMEFFTIKQFAKKEKQSEKMSKTVTEN